MTTNDLHLILDIATEAGLGRAWVVRGVRKPARIYPEPGRNRWKYRLVGELDREQGGMLLLLYFPETDGSEVGVEEI